MLTDQSCRAASAQAKRTGETVTLRDDRANTGLELRCSARGTATFSLVYRIKGDPVPKRFKLGRFPSISLAMARDMLPALRTQIVQGIDPGIAVRSFAAETRQAEAARKGAVRDARIEEARKITVSQLIDDYLAAKGSIRSIRQYRQMLDLNVRRPWARLKASDITGRDIDDVLRAVATRGNTTQPQRVFEVVRAMLTFANKRGIISGTPWKQVTFDFPERVEARSPT